jgi:hypothetical protein
VTVESVDISLSESARAATKAAPGHGTDAVAWDEIAHKTGEETRLTVTFLLLITTATMIAGIGVTARSADPHRGCDGGEPRVWAAGRAVGGIGPEADVDHPAVAGCPSSWAFSSR